MYSMYLGLFTSNMRDFSHSKDTYRFVRDIYTRNKKKQKEMLSDIIAFIIQ